MHIPSVFLNSISKDTEALLLGTMEDQVMWFLGVFLSLGTPRGLHAIHSVPSSRAGSSVVWGERRESSALLGDRVSAAPLQDTAEGLVFS
jgi:hypothetical protein